MAEPINGTLPLMGLRSRPVLRRGAKFRHDAARGRWVILAPERILAPNEQAADVLQLCDGKRTVAEIAEILAQTYEAEPEAIASDVLLMLQDLADAGVLNHGE